jgi:hypothetical protein
MSEPVDTIQLEIEPIPPDTISTVKPEIVPLIEKVLRESGRTELLQTNQFQVNIEKNFPSAEIVVVGLTFLTNIALEAFKELVLPEMKKHWKIKQKSKRNAKKSKK